LFLRPVGSYRVRCVPARFFFGGALFALGNLFLVRRRLLT
jgi:hypothetical protein